MTEEASAFVPGHVTGFFSVHPDEDPMKTGSRGAGLALTDGVTVTARPASEPTVALDGEAIEVASVETVLRTLQAPAHVTVESDLPLGSGFGVSGAMALGSALVANHIFERGLSRNELVAIAHGAETEAGTGLGDVVAQDRGGAPIRLEPGAPPHGQLDAIPQRARVEYVTFGELDTGSIIGGETDVITAAGSAGLSLVVDDPTLSTFAYASRKFARETELLTPTVRETIESVAEAGGQAAMAMLGETVFAFGTGLTDAGYDAAACAIDPCGARLL